MIGKENRTTILANQAKALRGAESFSTRFAPLTPVITGLRLTRKSRFAQVGSTQPEIWAAAVEPTVRISWTVKAPRVSVAECKRGLPRVTLRRIHETFDRLYAWSLGPFAISNRGGLALWLF